VSENVGECRRMSEAVVDFCEVRQTPGLAVVILGVPDPDPKSELYDMMHRWEKIKQQQTNKHQLCHPLPPKFL
jgi:hypothetical protein